MKMFVGVYNKTTRVSNKHFGLWTVDKDKHFRRHKLKTETLTRYFLPFLRKILSLKTICFELGRPT